MHSTAEELRPSGHNLEEAQQQKKAEIAWHQNMCCYGKNRRRGRKGDTLNTHLEGEAGVRLFY